MKKEHTTFLSALIFIAYGLVAHKYLFIGVGLVFVLIGVADLIRKRK